MTTSSALIPLETAPKAIAAPGAIPERWLVRASQAFLAIWVLFYLIHGASAALWFDGWPANGPFQIFDPLRRIAAGQTGGRDFVFFHGIGIPYLHYPLFALFGGNTLTASEISRQGTSIILFLSSLAAFTWVTVRRASWVWIAAATSVMLMEAVFPFGPAPGHSLIAARSTMAVFAFTALQLSVRPGVKAMLTGCCIGLAFVFGTEHAIGLAIALILITAITMAQSYGNRSPEGIGLANIKFAAMALAAAVVPATLFLLLFCGVQGARDAIHYSLVELPADQFWLFSSPPMPFLGAWRELVFTPHVVWSLLPTYVAIAILGWVLFTSWKSPLRLGRDWQALATFMLLYGILSGVPLLGILSRHYVFPLVRTLIAVALLVWANGAMPRWPGRWAVTRWRGWPAIAAFSFATACLIAAVALAYNSAVLSVRLVRHLRSESPVYSRFLDDKWNTFMAQTTELIDSTRKRNTVSLWSAYSALLEWHYGVFHPAEDYIIHSGGPQRWQRYLMRFRAADSEFVTTMTPDFPFEEWLQNERWEFYEDLLNNYTLLKRVNHATIWQRREGPWRVPAPGFRTVTFDGNSGSFTLPVVSGPDRLGVVRVRYAISNPWGWFPLIGKTPRYLGLIEGTPRHLAISFPPYRSEFQFPVQLRSGKPVTLRFQTTSLLPGVAFQPEQVQLKVLDWQPSQKAIFAPGI